MAAFHRYAKYGVQTDVYFTLPSPAATSSDRNVTTAPGSLFAAGDVKISKDGGALTNATNTPTQVTASAGLYKLVVTATEMQATQVVVMVVDQDGPAWRDSQITIETKLVLGQIDVDATAIGGNTSGMSLKGVGTKYGLEVLHNSSNILLHNLLDIIEPAEPSTSWAAGGSVIKMLQLLTRRFFNKVTQTSTQEKQYKDDASTVLMTMTCSDDGTTQTKGAAS